LRGTETIIHWMVIYLFTDGGKNHTALNDCIEIRSRDDVEYVISFLPPAFQSSLSSAAQIHLLSGFPHCNGMLTFYFSGFCFQRCYF